MTFSSIKLLKKIRKFSLFKAERKFFKGLLSHHQLHSNNSINIHLTFAWTMKLKKKKDKRGGKIHHSCLQSTHQEFKLFLRLLTSSLHTLSK